MSVTDDAALGRIELPAGFQLIVRDAVASTNDEAKQLGRAGAPDGTVIWAKRQEAGRGRQGRFWHSPEGNLYMSVLLRPACAVGAAAQLSFVAALALDDALAPLLPPGVQRRLKWPNDVLLDDQKAAGILLEAENDAARALAFVVLGIGVNVASHPDGADRPTTSLARLGVRCDVAALLSRLLASLSAWRRQWTDKGFGPVRAAWLSRSYRPGSPMAVRLGGEKLEGAFAGLDAAGTLLLDVGGPAPRRISAGDVFFGGA